jgi:hypothetical protein
VANKWIIHKHSLQLNFQQGGHLIDAVRLPESTIILGAGIQNRNIVIWYARPIEDNDFLCTIMFKVYATGEMINEDMDTNEFGAYIGTVIDNFVYHIFSIRTY